MGTSACTDCRYNNGRRHRYDTVGLGLTRELISPGIYIGEAIGWPY